MTTISRIKELKLITNGAATIKDMAFVIGDGMNKTDGLIKHRILKLIDIASGIHISDMAFIIGPRAKLNGSKMDSAGLITSGERHLALTDDGLKKLNELNEKAAIQDGG